MKNGLLSLLFFCICVGVNAQDAVFTEEALQIATKIDSITTAGKESLKEEIKAIDQKLKDKELTAFEADKEKKRLAQLQANKINEQIAEQEQKLKELVQKRANGQLKPTINDAESPQEIINYLNKKKTEDADNLKGEKRLTNQFVLMLGGTRAIKESGGYYPTDFESVGYSEIGIDFKYRLMEESPLWNLKFGVSLSSEAIKTENNHYKLEVMEEETNWVYSDINYKKSTFSRGFLQIPIHLELDFSKPKYSVDTKKHYVNSQQSWRFGLGGFIGLRMSSGAGVKYKENGNTIREGIQGRLNSTNWNFGPSVYVGYKSISLFTKYSVPSVFENNPVDLNMLNFGVRVDWN
ncbi:hypothetical protein SAMN05216480_103214 [Pustulibacterium marinum]|uniref:Outer membrane protein beta-barrel domain-containing protein n=1 Tax=Pustulibacterium marinum TaxID=1224947 RepID=A0A1I7G5V6_9FLAO|nr:hypothetical protein [Pustulibacterium marinum]SFU43837.1 hypothetical protein SAMN05216480_103214 [Pustulibacterium marinum]